MNVVVFYNEALQDATVDERDVLVQRDAVCEALRRLGHETTLLSCTLDLAPARERLLALRPDVVFNLVESLAGTDRLAPMATLLLESLGLPFTGSSTGALLATNDKLAAKRRLLEAGLPTPAWFVDRWCGGDPTWLGVSQRPPRAIIKAVWEHASFGMDDDAVISLTPDIDLDELLRSRQAATGKQHFAEQFIEGREFNLTVLGGPEGPLVLPPAEIDFGAFPEDKPHIVGYRAKWDEGSFEYHHTPRRFAYPPEDTALLERLTELAERCWREFDLRGYARVDFRVDRAGQPWILEVNANPCLSPDAGLAAAVEHSGMGYDRMMEAIVDDALPTGSHVSHSPHL
jgi:D-alanine-D-alanine ligase